MKYIVKTEEMPWQPKFFPGEEKTVWRLQTAMASTRHGTV